MKNILKYTLLIVVVSFSDALYANNNCQHKEDCYLVYRIEINKPYIEIFAIKDGVQFQIISSKQRVKKGKKIKVGFCYEFDLKEQTEFSKQWLTSRPMNYLDYGTGKRENLIRIRYEEGITELHYGENIRGRYVIN